jgi:hypothetical protein
VSGVPCAGARAPFLPDMTVEPRQGPPAPWEGERGVERLFARVCSACRTRDGLPGRLEAGLRAALVMLAEEPDLARLLTVDPYLGDDRAALDAHRAWIGRFGDLLRRAAADDPAVSRESDFLASFLIGGIRFQIARLVLKKEAADLPRLLPGLLDALLAYYFEPREPRRLAAMVLENTRAV